jgi:hypothetical protein
MSAISARSENGLTIMSQVLKRKNLPMYTPKAFSHITAQIIKPETRSPFAFFKSISILRMERIPNMIPLQAKESISVRSNKEWPLLMFPK